MLHHLSKENSTTKFAATVQQYVKVGIQLPAVPVVGHPALLYVKVILLVANGKELRAEQHSIIDRELSTRESLY